MLSYYIHSSRLFLQPWVIMIPLIREALAGLELIPIDSTLMRYCTRKDNKTTVPDSYKSQIIKSQFRKPTETYLGKHP